MGFTLCSALGDRFHALKFPDSSLIMSKFSKANAPTSPKESQSLGLLPSTLELQMWPAP